MRRAPEIRFYIDRSQEIAQEQVKQFDQKREKMEDEEDIFYNSVQEVKGMSPYTQDYVRKNLPEKQRELFDKLREPDVI